MKTVPYEVAEALARALGHTVHCPMMSARWNCTCGAAKQQAQALADYEHWKTKEQR